MVLAGVNFFVGIIFYMVATKYFFKTTYLLAIVKSVAIRLIIFMAMFLVVLVGIWLFSK